MPLVTSKKLLLDAQEGCYAVGAFNVENMEMVQAVVAAAEELCAPVILQTTPSTLKYADVDFFYANVKTAAEKSAVPVVMHLDHGNSFDLAMQAFRAGYTSIMIDGSPKPFSENVQVTRAVANACHPAGIPVEAELGKVGGKEDGLIGGEGNPYTDPRRLWRPQAWIFWLSPSAPPTAFIKACPGWTWTGCVRSELLCPFLWSSTAPPACRTIRSGHALPEASARSTTPPTCALPSPRASAPI